MKDHAKALTKICFAIFGLCLLWMLVFPGKQSPQKPNVGEHGFLGPGDVVNTAISKEAHDAMLDAGIAKDENGYKQLVFSGQVVVAEKNTKVLVLTTGLLLYKVRLLEGMFAGRTVFVAPEWVHSQKQ